VTFLCLLSSRLEQHELFCPGVQLQRILIHMCQYRPMILQNHHVWLCTRAKPAILVYQHRFISTWKIKMLQNHIVQTTLDMDSIFFKKTCMLVYIIHNLVYHKTWIFSCQTHQVALDLDSTSHNQQGGPPETITFGVIIPGRWLCNLFVQMVFRLL
jgi:hypothetical protein